MAQNEEKPGSQAIFFGKGARDGVRHLYKAWNGCVRAKLTMRCLETFTTPEDDEDRIANIAHKSSDARGR